MTLYEFFKSNESVTDTLTKNGIIPCLIVGYLSLYEDVLTEQDGGMIPTDSYWEVADKRNVSINTVIRAVVKMKNQIT
ncbi:MAG: hypothetical protein ACOYO1_17810 [Bacteroidales bacterium]